MLNLVNFLDTPYATQLESRNWRNSDQVTRYFKIKYISCRTHENWLRKLCEIPPSVVAFFIDYNACLVGVTYFHSIDYLKQQCDWGIYIHDVTYRGKKIGRNALELSLAYAQKHLMMKRVYLEVLCDNTVAINLYERMGFSFIGDQGNRVLRYMMVLN